MKALRLVSRNPLSYTARWQPIFRRALSFQVQTIQQPLNNTNIDLFRELTDGLTKPLTITSSATATTEISLPAQEKWFERDPTTGFTTLSPYLEAFSHLPFPYELIAPQPVNDPTTSADPQDVVHLFLSWLSEQTSPREVLLSKALSPLKPHLPQPSPSGSSNPSLPPPFLQFHAPLSLLSSALSYNAQSPHPLRTLYIAQSPIPDLPPALSSDLPTPDIVRRAGKGDVYASSIWLGLEPTYTPLHRDPNPNLFVQLRGAKRVRLLPPRAGDALFREVQRLLGRGAGSSRIRAADMMHGPERQLLHERVWGVDGEGRSAGGGVGVAEGVSEVMVRAGDALFIPTGWWHSVRSAGESGALNASVNWWFR